jgi:heme exporter protein C
MHGFANPARFLRLARWLMPLLLGLGLVLAFGALAWGLLVVPPDRLMGDTVRILFIHVPSAWLGMAGWSTIAVASLVELVWRHPLAAIGARAAAVPGRRSPRSAWPRDRSGRVPPGARGGCGTAG